MKKLGLLLACVAALALPTAALAASGAGHAGLQAHLQRATAKVAKYTAACKVANPAANCDARKAKLSARLNAWDARLQTRIAKVSAKPDSAAKTAKLARLNDALTQVGALGAQL